MRSSAILMLGYIAFAAALPAATSPDESAVDLIERGSAENAQPVAAEGTDIESTLTTPLDLHDIEKRSAERILSSDANHVYHATYEGKKIAFRMFFNLQFNRAVFSWIKDGNHPAPASVTLAFKDFTTGASIDAASYLPGQTVVLHGFSIGSKVRVSGGNITIP